MTKTRIYEVITPNSTRLVEAATRAGAISHVARNEIRANVATQNKLVELLTFGIPVETAGAENNA